MIKLFSNVTFRGLSLSLFTALLASFLIVGCDKSPQPTADAGGSSSTATATTVPSWLASASPAKTDAPQQPGMPAPTTPAATPAKTDVPTGYFIEASTDSGKSLVTQKSNIASVDAALISTFGDLTAFFSSKPAIGSAYQDAHDTTTGGATFSVTKDGQPLRGIVSCKLHDGSASITVIYGRSDAPKADWEKLMAAPPPQAQAQGQDQSAQNQPPPGAEVVVPGTPADNPANPPAQLTEYTYADGTGSVGLADGWTTQCQSNLDPESIKGPANQSVLLHFSVNVNTPDSLAVRNRQQMDAMTAQSAQRGFNFPQSRIPPLLVAAYSDPVTALQTMIPQFSARSEFNNGPSFTLDHIISSEDLKSPLPTGNRALLKYVINRTVDGQSTPYRVQMLLITAPFQGPNSAAWMWFTRYAVQAPDATFDHDFPLMMQMVNSEKINQERTQQVASARNQQMWQATQQMAADSAARQKANFEQFQRDQQTRFDIHEQQQAQTEAGYAAHNQQFNNYEWQRSRNAADFNESIGGTRMVYDTVTGQSGYANLTDVNGVVDSLNQAALDPNRFVQIPLRDQLYPNPPGQ